MNERLKKDKEARGVYVHTPLFLHIPPVFIYLSFMLALEWASINRWPQNKPGEILEDIFRKRSHMATSTW